MKEEDFIEANNILLNVAQQADFQWMQAPQNFPWGGGGIISRIIFALGDELEVTTDAKARNIGLDIVLFPYHGSNVLAMVYSVAQDYTKKGPQFPIGGGDPTKWYYNSNLLITNVTLSENELIRTFLPQVTRINEDQYKSKIREGDVLVTFIAHELFHYLGCHYHLVWAPDPAKDGKYGYWKVASGGTAGSGNSVPVEVPWNNRNPGPGFMTEGGTLADRYAKFKGKLPSILHPDGTPFHNALPPMNAFTVPQERTELMGLPGVCFTNWYEWTVEDGVVKPVPKPAPNPNSPSAGLDLTYLTGMVKRNVREGVLTDVKNYKKLLRAAMEDENIRLIPFTQDENNPKPPPAPYQ